MGTMARPRDVPQYFGTVACLAMVVVARASMFAADDEPGAPRMASMFAADGEPGAPRIKGVRVDGVFAPVYVDPVGDEGLHLSWELDTGTLPEVALTGTRVRIHTADAGTRRTLVYDSGYANSTVLLHRVDRAEVRGGFPPDQTFAVTVASYFTSVTKKMEKLRMASTVVRFHTGLRTKDDWGGAIWIGGFTELRSPVFTLPSTLSVSSATAYASGVGCFDLFINDQVADPNSRLDPGFSTIPTMRILYRAINVTDILAGKSGDYTVGFRLGMCKYGYLETFCKGAHAGNANCRAAILRLSIRFTDGSTRNITTGEDWFGTTAYNPIRYTHLFHGEIFDARIVTTRSNQAQHGWEHAIAYDVAKDGLGDAVLSLHDMPIIGVSERRRAVSIRLSNLTGGAPADTMSYIFDVGQNIAGVVELNFSKLHSPLDAGVTLTLRHSEITYSDGSLYNVYCDTEPNRIVPCNKGSMDGNAANQTDSYTFSGHETESLTTITWSPRFTYHGFRYVMITGFPKGSPAPPLDFVTGLFVHSLVEKKSTVSFSESLPILNHIETMIRYTILGNLHSHPTDCPQREKRGWLGDAQWVSGAANLRFGMSKLYGNWLRTFGDTQAVECEQVDIDTLLSPFRPPTYQCCSRAHPTFGCDWTGTNFSDVHGSLPDVVPYSRKTYGGWPGDPTWGAAAAVIPWEILARTGQVPSAQTYSIARSFVDFLTRHVDEETGLVEFGYYGDWCSAEPTSKPQVTGWSHILAVARIADMAEALAAAGGAGDYSKDAAEYTNLLNNLKKAYHKAYFRPKDGNYGPSQTANALPLYLNITPPALIPGVAKSLGESFQASKNGLLSGAMGTRYVLQALAENGYQDVAFAVVTETSQPSFGYMALQGPAGGNPGAGTVWEKWEGSSHDYGGGSKNHPMFSGGIGVYLYGLAGISQAQSRRIKLSPGGGDFHVAAQIGGAEVVVATGTGILSMKWLVAAPVLSVNVSVPLGLFQSVELFIPVPKSPKSAVGLVGSRGHAEGHFAVDIGGAEIASGAVRVDLEAGKSSWELTF
eukprot:g380.t1